MQTLQALHEKFDIPDPARGEFDIDTALFAPAELLVDSRASLGNHFVGSKIRRRLVNQRLREVKQLASRQRVASRNARFDQHLQLPVAASRGVLVLCAFERLTNLAIPAMRT